MRREIEKHMRVSSAACENEQSSASGLARGRVESTGNTVPFFVSSPAAAELVKPMAGSVCAGQTDSLEMHDPALVDPAMCAPVFPESQVEESEGLHTGVLGVDEMHASALHLELFQKPR